MAATREKKVAAEPQAAPRLLQIQASEAKGPAPMQVEPRATATAPEHVGRGEG